MLALALAMHLATQATAGPCDHAVTTTAMTRCLADTLRAREDSLRGVEKLIRSAVSPDARRRFEGAADDWAAYRERECRALGEHFAGGSMASVAVAGCRLTLTDQRIAFLQQAYAAILPGKD